MNRRIFFTWLGLSWLINTSTMVIAAALSQGNRRQKDESNSEFKPVVFYVAPNGNDRWSGKEVNYNQNTKNGPFATIERARDAIRELKRQQGGVLKQPVNVFLRGGTYFLSDTLIFTPEDSGTENCFITYAAYQDEKPVLSGGRRLTGWKPVTVNNKRLWTAEIPEVQEGRWFFRQLWVNGERRTRARHPSKGYLQIAEVLDPPGERTGGQGQTRFKYHPGDISNWL